MVIQRSTQPRIKIIGRRPDSDEWIAIDEDEEAEEEIPGVVRVPRSAIICKLLTLHSSLCESASPYRLPTPGS